MDGNEWQDYGHIFHGRKDHYMVGGYLNENRKAIVYLASVLDSGLEVAVKQIDSTFTGGLEREAVAQILIQQGGGHQNILPAYEFIKEEGAVVFPYLKSGNLKELQRRIGKFTPRQALSIVLPLCDAVEYLHSLGIVHRDIKGSNVLMETEGAVMPVSCLELARPKLSDFDLSWHKLTSHLDEEDVIYGTPNYIAPEVWRREGTSKLQDVYALGVLLYELVVGFSPFARLSCEETMYAHLLGDVIDVNQFNSQVTPGLSLVIEKALSMDPAERHQSAAELESDLKRVREELVRGR